MSVEQVRPTSRIPDHADQERFAILCYQCRVHLQFLMHRDVLKTSGQRKQEEKAGVNFPATVNFQGLTASPFLSICTQSNSILLPLQHVTWHILEEMASTVVREVCHEWTLVTRI